MKLIDILISLKKQNDINKVLIFNDFSITKQNIIELGKYFKDLYISYYNNFALRNLYVQLRSYSNIHIVQPNLIPNINYDIVCSSELTKPILLILSRIKYIKYFYCTNSDIKLDVEIPGFIKDKNILNLYKRDSLTLLINEENEDNKSLNEELIELQRNERIKKEEENENNQRKILNNLKNKNFIIIKNIISTLTKFSFFKEQSTINNGELDICCILSNKKDYDLFLKVVNYLNKNYSYVKYFIFLSGKTILKYFKEEKIKNLNYTLIKSNNQDDINNSYYSIFEILANGSYKFYMNDINFDLEMIDLL